MIKDPPINFSTWIAWADRASIKNAHQPGVYLICKWGNRAPSQVDPLAKLILYIGEVSDGSLLGRWQQFERAAFRGTPGHRGGIAYHETFGDEGTDLYVATYIPEGLRRDLRPLWIRHVHARLLWDYARTWDSEPLLNAPGG